jgi:hypothetical protein
MTGDEADVAARLKRMLPPWFGQSGGTIPVIDAVFAGAAWALAFVYQLYSYAKLQTRLSTATDGWLDLAAEDFFGDQLPRKAGEADAAYSARIRAALLAPSNTTAAISGAVTSIVGATPRITEPWRPDQTGTWGGPRAFYWGVDTVATPFRWTSASGGRFFMDVPAPNSAAPEVVAAVRRLKIEGVLAKLRFSA